MIDGITLYNFFVEMVVAVCLFVFNLPRKKRFWLRAAICLAFIGVLWYLLLFVVPDTWLYLNFAKYILLFFSFVAGILLCWDVGFDQAAYIGISAYALQHINVKLNVLVRVFGGVFANGDWFGAYYIVTPIFFIYAYFVFARRVSRELIRFDSRVQLTISGFLLVVAVFMSLAFGWSFSGENYSIFIAFTFCDIFCMTLVLIIQYFYFDARKSMRDKEAVETALYYEKRQYEAMEELIERINIKSHDLKHQLMDMGGKIRESEKEEILQTISLYDGMFRTGNSALDTVLMQKKPELDKNKIVLSCMADAGSMDFMEPSDIYSLFGNILDNAIEACRNLDEARRYCVLNIGKKGGNIVIHEENEYIGHITLENGLPLTSKADKAVHGFGTKSIRLIVKKYGGTYAIDTDGEVFTSDILIPIPDNAQNASVG